MTQDELLENGNYLPLFMRNFHCQKNVFKRIERIVENRRKQDEGTEKELYSKNLPNWIMAHIYVVDFFLWYMATCGYTLQKTRHAKGDFVDIVEDIKVRYNENG